MSEDHTDWSRQQWSLIGDGGVWAVPRSGLVFQRRFDKLMLFARMPHTDEMPMSSEQLRKQQDEDYERIKEEFGKIGVEVESEIDDS